MNLAQTLAMHRRTVISLHGTQRYGIHPYVWHLDQVLAVAFEYEIEDFDVLVATRWHDSREDVKNFDEQAIRKYVNPRVSSLVWAVTNAEGPKGKARDRATYLKIASTPGATALKLCDRIANVRNCWLEVVSQDENKRNKSKLGKYKAKYPAFRKALKADRCSSSEAAMWTELDRLLAWIK
jgi:(p)ppGpp synthase/HD superfamily hydrolase